MDQKKVPQRMCVICREAKDKRELIRLVRSSDGEIVLDTTGKASGRGAYICKEGSCLQKNLKTKQLNKIFKGGLSPEAYSNLIKEINEDRR